jgi:hypothetical protein
MLLLLLNCCRCGGPLWLSVTTKQQAQPWMRRAGLPLVTWRALTSMA